MNSHDIANDEENAALRKRLALLEQERNELQSEFDRLKHEIGEPLFEAVTELKQRTEHLQAALGQLREIGTRTFPIAFGTGRCSAVPCFDEEDHEVENRRKNWVVLDGDAWAELWAKLKCPTEALN